MRNYEHDMDGYTEAKGPFIYDMIEKAKKERRI